MYCIIRYIKLVGWLVTMGIVPTINCEGTKRLLSHTSISRSRTTSILLLGMCIFICHDKIHSTILPFPLREPNPITIKKKGEGRTVQYSTVRMYVCMNENQSNRRLNEIEGIKVYYDNKLIQFSADNFSDYDYE